MKSKEIFINYLVFTKQIFYGIIASISLSILGCSNMYMNKAELNDVFTKCGVSEIFKLDRNGNCLVQKPNGKIYECDINDLDPVSISSIENTGIAMRTYLNLNTIIPVNDKSGSSYSIPIDANTNVIFNEGLENETQMYFAGTTWLVDDYYVGLRSRLLGWGNVIKAIDVKSIRIYSEMTFKRSPKESCLQ